MNSEALMGWFAVGVLAVAMVSLHILNVLRSRTQTRWCVMCRRPLPERSWLDVIEPPPIHDPRRDPDCLHWFMARMGQNQ